MKIGKYNIGIMHGFSNIFHGWLNKHYLTPKALLLHENALKEGFQQYRWLKFYLTIPVRS